MNAWHSIGKQLQNPRGHLGKIIGHAMRVINTEPNRLAISALAVQPTDNILELGFGPGHAIAQMARLVQQGKVMGIDASATMLAQAVRRNRRAVVTGKVTLSLGRFFPLPMPDASLDKILAVNVIYFWESAPDILAECHRALRPGGKISIYATDASSMSRWKFAGQETHIHVTADTIRAALLQGGFQPENIRLQMISLSAGIQGILAIGQKSL